jgi:hypothetical protein
MADHNKIRCVQLSVKSILRKKKQRRKCRTHRPCGVNFLDGRQVVNTQHALVGQRTGNILTLEDMYITFANFPKIFFDLLEECTDSDKSVFNVPEI